MPHFIFPDLPADFADLAPEFERIASDVAERFVFETSRDDPTFGAYGELAALFRSSTASEGRLFEEGLRLLLGTRKRFILIEAGLKLPLIPAAINAVASNDAAAIASLRIDPDTYTRRHYTPDVIVVERETGKVFILELKRTSKSFGRGQIDALVDKMRAAGLVLSHTLFHRGFGFPIRSVSTLLVDCDNSDTYKRVTGTHELDVTLAVPGLGTALDYLRGLFAAKVQTQIAQCLARIDGAVPGPIAAEVVASDALAAECPKDMADIGTGEAEVCVVEHLDKPRMAKPPLPAAKEGKTFGEPDPAAITAAIRHGVMGEVDRTGVPAALREALRRQAAEGEPAAQMVLDWLDRLLLAKLDTAPMRVRV